jgi:phosphoglycolate phosphatase-like HAD superfamily hydrolase
MKHVYVFDADDTLWLTEWLYSRSLIKFFAFLHASFGRYTPNLYSIKNSFAEIDRELFLKRGVRRGRHAASMLRCYEEIAQWIEQRFHKNLRQPSHRAEIVKIGDEPFDHSQIKWIPEAKAVLKKLKNQGHDLCILSSYDKRFFADKISFLGVGKFFQPNRVLSVPGGKSKQDFIAASGWTPAKDKNHIWFAVGNVANDILPALEISKQWRGIYIPHPTTSAVSRHEKGLNHFSPPKIKNSRVATIRSFRSFPYQF